MKFLFLTLRVDRRPHRRILDAGVSFQICQKVDVVWFKKLQSLWSSSPLGDSMEATAVLSWGEIAELSRAIVILVGFW